MLKVCRSPQLTPEKKQRASPPAELQEDEVFVEEEGPYHHGDAPYHHGDEEDEVVLQVEQDYRAAVSRTPPSCKSNGFEIKIMFIFSLDRPSDHCNLFSGN